MSVILDASNGVRRKLVFDEVALLRGSWVLLADPTREGSLGIVGELVDGVLEAMEHGFDREGSTPITPFMKRLLNAPINVFLLNARIQLNFDSVGDDQPVSFHHRFQGFQCPKRSTRI